MSFESIQSNVVSGGSRFSASGLLERWTETTIINGFVPGNVNANYLPQLYDELPDQVIRVGQQGINRSYCTDVEIAPRASANGTATESFEIVATFVRPGACSQIQFDNYQQIITTNFDVDNKLAAVPYQTNLPLPQSQVPFIAGLKYPRIVQSFRIIQYEDHNNWTAENLLGGIRAYTNSDSVWGFAAGTLLTAGVRSFADGTPIYRREYSFLFNPLELGGFHHVYAVYVDARGLIPKDVTPINPATVAADAGTVTTNGAAAFRVVHGINFHDAFIGIKPPFPTGSGS